MRNYFQTIRPGILNCPLRSSIYISLIFLVQLFSTSCGTIKTSSYFKNSTRDTIIEMSGGAETELTIKKGDQLMILVSSLNKEEDELYNIKSVSGTQSELTGYEVGVEGAIFFHKIGKIQVDGFTRKQVKATLENKLKDYLKDPIVTVHFGNHHVTVIGEIDKPQVLPMPGEKISIIDLLAQSGTLRAMTELSDVTVIREKDNKKELKHLNLEDNSIFNSPYYYLQPNDIVVLNANEKRVQRDIKRQNYQQISSIVLQAVTVSLIIYQTFFRK